MNAALVRGEQIDNDAMIRTSSEARRIWSALTAKGAKAKPAANGQAALFAHIAEKYGTADQTADEDDIAEDEST